MHAELVEMFPGGGTLTHALTAGLARAGLSVSVAGLVEIEARYLAVSSRAHPEASTWHGDAAAFDPAELSAPKNAPRIFVAGIPCTGASRAGRAKNRLSCAEDHADAGALFLPVAHYIRRHRPELVALECVDTYRNTTSAACLRDALAVAGYQIDERVIDPLKEFATPSQRKRWVLAASRIGRFSWFYETEAFASTLADYLDPENADDAAESATPEQVAAAARYCARKQAEGCGFALSLVDRTSTRCGTIPRTYGKRQHSATYVRTAKSYRQLRPHEVARLHGFPPDLFAGLPRTLQFELYGQGVVAAPFVNLGAAFGRFLRGEASAPASGQLELFAS